MLHKLIVASRLALRWAAQRPRNLTTHYIWKTSVCFGGCFAPQRRASLLTTTSLLTTENLITTASLLTTENLITTESLLTTAPRSSQKTRSSQSTCWH